MNNDWKIQSEIKYDGSKLFDIMYEMKHFHGCCQFRIICKYLGLFISEIVTFTMWDNSFLFWLLHSSFWKFHFIVFYNLSIFWRWTQSHFSVRRVNKQLMWMTWTWVGFFAYKKPQMQIFCILKLVYLLFSPTVIKFMKLFTLGITMLCKWKA